MGRTRNNTLGEITRAEAGKVIGLTLGQFSALLPALKGLPATRKLFEKPLRPLTTPTCSPRSPRGSGKRHESRRRLR